MASQSIINNIISTSLSSSIPKDNNIGYSNNYFLYVDKLMDTENTNDEQNQSISKGTIQTKLRMKERSRSQTTPTNTDINDPENLDYEDIDDNHQVKQIQNSVKKINDEEKSSVDIQDEEEDKTLNNQQKINNGSSNNQAAASDEGEVDEADLEDGEIHDPSTTKNDNASSDEQSLDQNRNQTNTGVPLSPQAKVHCRFFLQGRCHWGPNCKYIHPNNDSIKNLNNAPVVDGISSLNNDISPPSSASISTPQPTNNSWISPQATAVAPTFFPNPVLRGQAPPSGMPLVPPSGTESAWERGLRSAKTLREQSMRRKQQDKDFNDKKFNLTIRDALDEREADDNLLNIDRPSLMDYDQSGSNYIDQRGYSDRYHPYMYSNSSNNSHYNNNNHHRMNNNNNNSRHNQMSSTNDHLARRSRHSNDYTDSRNDNRNRKDKLSTKDNKSTSKRDDILPYKRNPSQQQYVSGSHHNNDEQLHPNPYNNRRGDDWHDPWDRSRNHGGGGSNRRSSGGGREVSYSSSSASSSRSRSRSRPKRRSPSVTRATKSTPTTKSSEMAKNGNDKKSNGNKKLVSPSATTNKFLPGRQISSHTLKKAEKSSISSNSTTNNHSKDQRGKDSDINTKKQLKKENINRSDSTSSSSSSDSDTNRVTHRSSSSSSDSSSSENDTRTSAKTKT
ncbi:unnamed protein product, partial [Adineta steineri]